MASNGQRPHTRKFVRVPVDMPVEYSYDGEDIAKVAHAVDLGGGGMRIATEDDLPQGTFLLLRFRLPDAGREILARARIVLSSLPQRPQLERSFFQRSYCAGVTS